MAGLPDLGARLLRNRRLVRAPIWLYRIGAGAVFGSRILMLEHIGRTSGAHRYVVLEVVGRPSPDSIVVASGFGDKAQWFRNVVVNPRVRVWLGSHRPVPAVARVLDQQAVDQVLAEYRAQHPKTWDQFKLVLEETLGQPITDTGAPLPMVELRLQTSR
ncbi:nitroreductase family deazaflavin-dependent oxidoreductase [Mycolicibacterium fortuitum]|uniref:nitroreductase family deazaflavin-dependent oxidoreductase n=1 Tax=Mycolicibacterium fortuitum TaxID=1766 RepID=UPI001CDBFEE7|nr:nitroreductase family deazaflavin-dependent oxidoreductase [Mycolicibacterium fortuitum]MCA4751874.1 nitroreductase family deazaflavin-dependent oxidoreductase [Mycolicibacterium fortuitum]UBV19065.1 nitroreductase family deazaflavin-dependent oxidoreductase [Mycolicibacterium fortuitum]